MIEPEFRNRLIPAGFGALATIVALIEFGAVGGPLDTRALVIAGIGGLLCLAAHCFSVFEFSKTIVASQLGLAFVATVQVALLGLTKADTALEYVPIVWMLLATPAIHLGLLAKQTTEWSKSLYPIIAMVFGALAPSGLLWFTDTDLARVQFSVVIGLAAAIAAVIVTRIDQPVPEDALVR